MPRLYSTGQKSCILNSDYRISVVSADGLLPPVITLNGRSTLLTLIIPSLLLLYSLFCSLRKTSADD